MRLRGLLALAPLLSAGPALADDVADFTDALNKAATGAILAEAYMAVCDRVDSDSATVRRDAMAGWSYRVDLPAYHRFLEAAAKPLPDLIKSLEAHVDMARVAVEEEFAADDSACATLPAQLREAPFDIERPIRYLVRNAADFSIEIAEAPVATSTQDIELVPLAMLSAQLIGKMDEIGSKAGAQVNRDLREAREEHAKAWLEQRQAVVAYGRVIDEDEVREWRGDQQSAFAARCQSFADDAQETTMQSAVGQDRVIAGTIRWIRDDREGGVIALNDCRVFTYDPEAAELASMDDDSAGLMLRPPEYDEAFAGPGAGIALGDIDRVMYDAEFQNRIDGFGNGYTDRQEDIYVLLRDGTAYRHDWNFAFTDLDVSLSKRREPDRWFTWRDDWGTLILTRTGGLDAGEQIDISKARRLMPVPPGQRLDNTYYYLNVGMGGGRSDREYVFSADGQLEHTRGGFFAGNFGTSYIIVSGDSDVTHSTYAFEDYTLLIDGPDGQERHFAALIEGQAADSPEEMIIDGQVHWRRKASE